MKVNMGGADRILRLILAAILVALYAYDVFTGILGVILLVAAGILVITSLVSFCPLYKVFGLRTCKAN
ncbi:Protein of unknown function (DUF2892) [Ulvibacter antarcticus]|uniref:Inner membrane protein YgaP-like transmembrane domain-containing protein n=2 Tax=Ulvibacter antarcticus TaxID=442714 RepID=A0A3L9YKV9_9FLAO|nr:Protein of unknown function (DUF2892) [Ulvibacter antarcticus]